MKPLEKRQSPGTAAAHALGAVVDGVFNGAHAFLGNNQGGAMDRFQ